MNLSFDELIAGHEVGRDLEVLSGVAAVAVKQVNIATSGDLTINPGTVVEIDRDPKIVHVEMTARNRRTETDRIGTARVR